MAFSDYEFKVKFRNGKIEVGYFKEYSRPLKPSDAIWIIGVVALLIIAFVYFYFPLIEAESEIKNAFNAFKNNNSVAWVEYVHPDYLDELGDLDVLKENMGRNALAINPESTVEDIDISSGYGDSSTYYADIRVKSGIADYKVTFVYVGGEEKSGICSVHVEYLYYMTTSAAPRFEPPLRTPAP